MTKEENHKKSLFVFNKQTQCSFGVCDKIGEKTMIGDDHWNMCTEHRKSVMVSKEVFYKKNNPPEKVAEKLKEWNESK